MRLSSNTERRNVVLSLHNLLARGYKRLILVVQRRRFSGDLETFFDIPHTSQVTGWRIVCVDPLIRGKGADFGRLKSLFDSPSPEPLAFLTYGGEASFLVGTDLAHADSVLTVGEVGESIITQAMGRIFRPRLGRGESPLPIELVNVCV